MTVNHYANGFEHGTAFATRQPKDLTTEEFDDPCLADYVGWHDSEYPPDYQRPTEGECCTDLSCDCGCAYDAGFLSALGHAWTAKHQQRIDSEAMDIGYDRQFHELMAQLDAVITE